MPLNREQILAHKHEPHIKEITAFGDSVHIRRLTVAEREELGDQISLGGSATAKWVIACLCDSEGKRLFNYSDIETVAGLKFEELNAVASECVKHNPALPVDALKKT